MREGTLEGCPRHGVSCSGCRYGYSSIKQLNRVVDSYAYAQIPLETFVTDSQYMNHDQDFTLGVEFNVSSFQARAWPAKFLRKSCLLARSSAASGSGASRCQRLPRAAHQQLSVATAQAFVAKLNAAGQRWVPILDPPIHVSPGYPAYDSGIANDVFLKDITGRPFVGQVPDWLSSGASPAGQSTIIGVALQPLLCMHALHFGIASL